VLRVVEHVSDVQTFDPSEKPDSQSERKIKGSRNTTFLAFKLREYFLALSRDFRPAKCPVVFGVMDQARISLAGVISIDFWGSASRHDGNGDAGTRRPVGSLRNSLPAARCKGIRCSPSRPSPPHTQPSPPSLPSRQPETTRSFHARNPSPSELVRKLSLIRINKSPARQCGQRRWEFATIRASRKVHPRALHAKSQSSEHRFCLFCDSPRGDLHSVGVLNPQHHSNHCFKIQCLRTPQTKMSAVLQHARTM
jgi:hypothetical protein